MYAMANNRTTVSTLLSVPNIRLQCTATYGCTGLHLACRSNSSLVIPLYGQNYRCSLAIINMKDNQGKTALMMAVEGGCLGSIEELDGTDFTMKNIDEETLIDVARRQNNDEVLQYLLNRNKAFTTKAGTSTLETMRMMDINE